MEKIELLSREAFKFASQFQSDHQHYGLAVVQSINLAYFWLSCLSRALILNESTGTWLEIMQNLGILSEGVAEFDKQNFQF